MPRAGKYGKSQGLRMNLPVSPAVRDGIEALWRARIAAGGAKISEAQLAIDLIVEALRLHGIVITPTDEDASPPRPLPTIGAESTRRRA